MMARSDSSSVLKISHEELYAIRFRMIIHGFYAWLLDEEAQRTPAARQEYPWAVGRIRS